jgi:hypothetical protein
VREFVVVDTGTNNFNCGSGRIEIGFDKCRRLGIPDTHGTLIVLAERMMQFLVAAVMFKQSVDCSEVVFDNILVSQLKE